MDLKFGGIFLSAFGVKNNSVYDLVRNRASYQNHALIFCEEAGNRLRNFFSR